MKFKDKLSKIQNKIFTGDAYYILKLFPDNIIDCINTSPPYYQLRSYGQDVYTIWTQNPKCNHEWKLIEISNPNSSGGQNSSKLAIKDTKNFQESASYHYRKYHYYICPKCNGEKFQLGLEPTVDLYVKHLCNILDEIKRVLKPSGTLFLNIGDTYDSKTGNLLLVPYKVAFEMQNRGWIIKNIINWCKKILYFNNETNKWETQGNGLPESQKIRFVKNDETIIFATKSKYNQHFFNFDALKLGWSADSIERLGRANSSANKYFSHEFHSQTASRGLCKPRENINKYKKSKSKYKDMPIFEDVTHTNRTGLNRDMDKSILKRNLPNRKEFATWLKNILKEKNLKKEFLQYFGKSKAEHWLRRDASGFAFPSFGEWLSIKKFLNLETTPFDEQMETLIEDDSALKIGYKRIPNNWLINTENSSELHYAIQPTKIAYLTLLHGCPLKVCAECGAPYRKKYKLVKQSDGTTTEIEEGWQKDCLCKTDETISGIVLDPFAGIGTTLLKAIEMGFNFVGIEKSVKYSKTINKRLKEKFGLFL